MSSLATVVTFMAMIWPGLSPVLLPEVQQAAAPQGHVLYLAPGELEAAGLDPSMRERLPGLIAAALGSGGGYVVTAALEGAGWKLMPAVSGRGPWRLSARLEPVGSGGRGISTKKHPFSDRESLTGAVEALVSDLHAGLAPGGSAGPLPLSRALSGSTLAVDRYLDAMNLLRAGEVSKARGQLDAALAADPSMCPAALERAFLDFTAGDKPAAAAVLAAAHAGGACGSPRSEAAMRGFELLARSDPSAVPHAEAMMVAPAARLAAHRIRGLALATSGRLAESAADWKAVSAANPDDARVRMWLGSALMAAGDFAGAAESLSLVTTAWPDLLRAWTLRAESQVRMRETGQARATLAGMKSFMTSRGIPVDADERNPDLMLGCVDLLEGHTIAALKTFEATLGALEKQGTPFEALDTLHNAIIEMRRNLIEGRDAMVRRRLLMDAKEAVDRYQSSQPPEHRLSRPWELARLRALIGIREGNMLDAWKTVDEIKSSAGQPGYSEYYEAQLSAAILLKEGDERGSAVEFERAARASGRIVDLIYVAQMQGNLRKYEDSHKTFAEIAQRLERYEPSAAGEEGRFGELVVVEPHLAAMIPIYHYTWARLAYETNKPSESRLHFSRMLKYLNKPDADLVPLVDEAIGRGARPE